MPTPVGIIRIFVTDMCPGTTTFYPAISLECVTGWDADFTVNTVITSNQGAYFSHQVYRSLWIVTISYSNFRLQHPIAQNLLASAHGLNSTEWGFFFPSKFGFFFFLTLAAVNTVLNWYGIITTRENYIPWHRGFLLTKYLLCKFWRQIFPGSKINWNNIFKI